MKIRRFIRKRQRRAAKLARVKADIRKYHERRGLQIISAEELDDLLDKYGHALGHCR